MAVKLIPAYIILLCALIIAADLSGAFGHRSGVISAKGILAMAISIIAGIALVGQAAAWVVYLLRGKREKQTV